MQLKRFTLLICLVYCVVFMYGTSASAHSGGTDACGGHFDHKRGGYHVHNWWKYNVCYPQSQVQTETNTMTAETVDPDSHGEPASSTPSEPVPDTWGLVTGYDFLGWPAPQQEQYVSGVIDGFITLLVLEAASISDNETIPFGDVEHTDDLLAVFEGHSSKPIQTLATILTRIPDGISPGVIMDVVYDYFESNPDLLQESAALLILASFEGADWTQ